MTRDDVDTICGSFPGATRAHPPELVSWKLAGKMFATFGIQGGEDGISVKTDSAETASMLIDAGTMHRAPYFHRSWVRFTLADVDPDEARHRLIVSYDLIRASLKKADRDALRPRED